MVTKKYGQKDKKVAPKKKEKKTEKKTVVTTDKWWASDGIGNRMVKSDDTKTLELLALHKWVKE